VAQLAERVQQLVMALQKRCDEDKEERISGTVGRFLSGLFTLKKWWKWRFNWQQMGISWGFDEDLIAV
jgi:hypothetical protein